MNRTKCTIHLHKRAFAVEHDVSRAMAAGPPGFHAVTANSSCRSRISPRAGPAQSSHRCYTRVHRVHGVRPPRPCTRVHAVYTPCTRVHGSLCALRRIGRNGVKPSRTSPGPWQRCASDAQGWQQGSLQCHCARPGHSDSRAGHSNQPWALAAGWRGGRTPYGGAE